MRDVILEVYRLLTFTPFADRQLQWVNAVIHKCTNCPVSDDVAANFLLGAALSELMDIRTYVMDSRSFPELAEVMPQGTKELAATVVSFLHADDEFIQGGYLFVLREFIFPLAKWHYSLTAQVQNISFHEFLMEHDPDIIEMIEPLRRMRLRLVF